MKYYKKIQAASIEELSDLAIELGLKVGMEFTKVWKEKWSELQTKLDKEDLSQQERTSIQEAFVDAIHGHLELSEMGMKRELAKSV